ncbi:MAG: RagB/SusD family nutrient uptake outer membrane protein [Bacteroidales bacterium]|jgi:hypothetical protein|nr:RagB/SusD family nutrient uptake outer membrane protein [Bacteroidales bacterium]
MRNLLKYIPFLAVLLLSGCDDFLNLNPVSQIGEGDLFTNQEEIEQGITACYYGLQAPIKDEWLLTELRTDNSRLRNLGSSSDRSVQIKQYDEANFYSTDPALSDYWANSYKNIKNCHKVLAHIDVVPDKVKREQYTGELLFIRAYHYFNLVRLYKDVFFVDHLLTADEAKNMTVTSSEKIYSDLIENDLLKAIEYLPESYVNVEKGRITNLAAKALLAKVHLTQKNYSEAEKWLLQVYEKESGGLVGLVSPFQQIFEINNEMNNEILFAVRFISGGYGIGCTFPYSFAALGCLEAGLKGEGENYPSQLLVKSYDPADARKDVTLRTTYKSGSQTIYDNWVHKYYSVVNTKEDGGNDWPVLRYSDVLLMLAEVRNEIDQKPDNAFQYVNPVRLRANLPALDLAVCPDYEAFKTAIENERRWEFAFENQRFFDLMRTGRYMDVLNNFYQRETYISKSTTGEEPVDTETEPHKSKFYWDSGNNTFRGYPMTADRLYLPMPNWDVNISNIY